MTDQERKKQADECERAIGVLKRAEVNPLYPASLQEAANEERRRMERKLEVLRRNREAAD